MAIRSTKFRVLLSSCLTLLAVPSFSGQSICSDSLGNDDALHGPINQGDFDFNYESRADKNLTGGYEINYCIQNNTQNGVLYVHWHDENGKVFFKKGVPGGTRKSRGGKIHFVDNVPNEEKKLEFGWDVPYQNSEDVDTFFAANADRDFRVVPAQFAESFGAPIADIVQDSDLMGKYLDFIREQNPDAQSLETYAWSSEWVPTTLEMADRISRGERIADGSAEFFEVRYAVVASISLEGEDIQLSTFVSIPLEMAELAFQSETLERLSINVADLNDLSIFSNGGFGDLRETRTINLGKFSATKELNFVTSTASLRVDDKVISEILFEYWIQ